MLFWAQPTKYSLSMIIYPPICKQVLKDIANAHSIKDFLYWWQINKVPSWNKLKGSAPGVSVCQTFYTGTVHYDDT